MLAVSSSTRVYLYMQPVDMRRSYDGLHAIVQGEFRCDIRLGDLLHVHQSSTRSHQDHVVGS